MWADIGGRQSFFSSRVFRSLRTRTSLRTQPLPLAFRIRHLNIAGRKHIQCDRHKSRPAPSFRFVCRIHDDPAGRMRSVSVVLDSQSRLSSSIQLFYGTPIVQPFCEIAVPLTESTVGNLNLIFAAKSSRFPTAVSCRHPQVALYCFWRTMN